MPLGQDHISCPLNFCALYLKCESLSLSYKEAGGCRAEGHDSPSPVATVRSPFAEKISNGRGCQRPSHLAIYGETRQVSRTLGKTLKSAIRMSGIFSLSSDKQR